MKDIRANNGQPLVIQQQSESLRIVGGIPSRITLNHCNGIELHGEDGVLRVCGAGEGTQLPLIAILNSSNVTLNQPVLSSLIDSSSKAAWMQTVCNGIAICPSSINCHIESSQMQHIHMGIINRANGLTIQGGVIDHWSGDAVHNASTADIRIIALRGQIALEVLPYERLHRDFIQLQRLPAQSDAGPSREIIRNVHVEDCELYAPDEGHPWAKSCDGIILTDGVMDNFVIRRNRIYTNNVNRIRLNPALNGEISGNVEKEAKYYVNQHH